MPHLLRRRATFCLLTALALVARTQLFAASPTIAPEKSGIAAVPENVGASIRAAMEEFQTPGLSVAVIDGGRIACAEGFGVCEEGTDRAVTTTTRFQAASISKPVSAAAALHLVSLGKLDLDQDVNEKLKSWKLPDSEKADGRKVTLRQLLCHGAGTTVHGFRGYADGESVPTVPQILDGQPPANSEAVRIFIRPGNVFRYSGGGYTIAQQLMIDVTGESFPALVQSAVLGPLEMQHSTYEQPLPTALLSEAATGHRAGRKLVDGRYHTYPEMAAAGLWTTPSDLARFAIAIQEELAGTSTKLFPQPMAEEMLKPQVKPHVGLGLMLAGKDGASQFSHGGANEGFRCQLVAYRTTGQGAVVMTNSDTGGQAAAMVIKAIGEHYHWPK